MSWRHVWYEANIYFLLPSRTFSFSACLFVCVEELTAAWQIWNLSHPTCRAFVEEEKRLSSTEVLSRAIWSCWKKAIKSTWRRKSWRRTKDGRGDEEEEKKVRDFGVVEWPLTYFLILLGWRPRQREKSHIIEPQHRPQSLSDWFPGVHDPLPKIDSPLREEKRSHHHPL